MSDLLNTGMSGLRAYSRSLATIGDNIANAQTPGYARRTLALREMPGTGNTVLVRPNARPGGVETAGLVRATDIWLQTEARLSSGDSARSGVRLTATGNVEAILADNQNGIATGLTRLFTTADQLTVDPGSTALRSQFLGAADQVATGFRQVAGRLSNLATTNATAATQAVGNVNQALSTLQTVNANLLRAREGSTQEASLLDERDRMIDQLASQLDVTAQFGHRGTVKLRAASGEVLVDNSAVQLLSVQGAADGRLTFSVSGQPLAVGSGELAGLADAGNHIADQRAGVDALADSIAAQLNAAHQAGRDASGQAGRPLFSGPGGAGGMTAAPLAAADVAAANGASTNGNMLAMASLRGPNGPEALWADSVSQQSRIGANARAQHDAATFRFDAATEARDNVQSIDLDREAADLIRFQQAYAAAAQTIQVARETLQTLFNAI
jgi:flagellar hook-associated protein 1